jgi:hypothetical protein
MEFDHEKRVVYHEVGGDTWNAIPEQSRLAITEAMDFVSTEFGGEWKFGTSIGQQSSFHFLWKSPVGSEGEFSIDMFEDWLDSDAVTIGNTILSRLFYMLLGIAEANGFR